jgi:GntR family transcriptional regulator
MANAETADTAGAGAARAGSADGNRGRRTSLLRQLRSVWFESATTGTPFPTETELVERFGASRSRVREAMVRLEAEGLIQRHAGAGTFANVTALGMPFRIDQSFEFSEMLSAAGYQPAVTVVSSGETGLDTDQAALFDMTAGAAAFTTTKLWTADGTPVMVAHDLVPFRRRPRQPVDPRLSIFDIARLLGREEVEWEGAAIAPCAAPPRDAALLGLEPGTPVLRLDLTGISRHSTRAYQAREYHSGTKFSYNLIRSVPQH